MSADFEHRAAAARMALKRHGIDHDRGQQVRVVRDNPRHIRGARTVFRIETSDPQSWVILKVFSETERAKVQYDFLQALRSKTAHVVQPVFWSADLGVLATRFVGERTALSIVQTKGQRAALRACSNWLNDFSSDVGMRERALDNTPLLNNIEPILRDIPHDATIMRNIAEEARAGFRHFNGKTHYYMTTFGDLKPENICLDKSDALIGVDGNPYQGEMPIESEIASLLHWGTMRRFRITLREGIGGWSLGHQIWRDRRTVLARMSQPIDRHLLDLMLRERLLREWARLSRLDAAPELRALIAAHLVHRKRPRF